MKIKKILVVYKKSTYELYNNDEYTDNVKKLIDEGHESVNMLKNSHNTHHSTLETIISVLKDKNIKFDVIFRGDLKEIEDYDLVITTGGDGTILETSKYLKNIPIFGVNSDPLGSVGFFTSSTKDNFEEKFSMALKGELKIKKLNRIQILINDIPVKYLALNDILISHSIPAATSRYVIKFQNRIERHRSSGIWISSSAGSTAAIRSAGGKILPIYSKKLQFVVREFYDRGSKDFKILKGIFNENDNFEIISQMRLGKIYIDGPFFEYDFTVGDSIKFINSKYPLNILGFSEERRNNFIKKIL
jgi:NAD+ kinase